MFTTLGRKVYAHRKLVLVTWLVVVVIGMAFGSTVMDRLDSEMRGSDRHEAVRVANRLEALGAGGAEIAAVIEGPADDRAVAAAIRGAADEIRRYSGVVSVLDHPSTGAGALVAEDGGAQVVVANLDPHLDADSELELAHQIVERLRAIAAPGVDGVVVGGSLLMNEEFREAAEKDLQRGESFALPIAMVAMVVIFGGILAAGLPILIALSSVVVTMTVLFAATAFTSVSVFAINVVTMFGIGLGIDYGLLVVSRFREERAAGCDVADAVARTVASAGRTVAFSGLTVAVALAGLFTFDEPGFRSFGIAGMGVVLISLAAGTTLLPALLAVLGRRIKPAKSSARDHGGFHRLALFVQRRAVPVAAVTALALAALAIPFFGANFESGDARSLPRSSESRAVALTLAQRFPGRGADPVTVVAEAGTGSVEVAAFAAGLGAIDGVADVTVREPLAPGVAVIDVVPTGTGQGAIAQRLVREIRSMDPPFAVEVGGPAAATLDFKHAIASRLPYALAVIAIATFVLLFLMTGSIAVPLKAILMNLLSLGASLGALVWIFQEGNLSGVLGFDATGSVDLFMPVLIFIFAFGLSMDYEVFLLARIKEVHDETGDNDLAVAVGLQRTGKIITSAALLIVVVFAGFAMGEVITIKQLGVGLALAVIVDATIVRSLLVPATMKLLGEWNWWAPAPLRRVHDRFGLRESEVAEDPALEPLAA
jgi:RND superfamily putative drug exporter